MKPLALFELAVVVLVIAGLLFLLMMVLGLAVVLSPEARAKLRRVLPGRRRPAGARSPSTERGRDPVPAAHPDVDRNADLRDDVGQALEWYRSALRERVPAEGEFGPVTITLRPASRRLWGFNLHLAIAGLQDGYASDHPRWLDLKVSRVSGGDMSTDVGLGTNAELLAQIDDGTTAAAVAKFLDRVLSESWRGKAAHDEGLAAGEAGHHAVSSPPAVPGENADLGPDIERALAWYRTTLEDRVPAEGDFAPVVSSGPLTATRLRGLTLHLTVSAFRGDVRPHEAVRALDGKVSSGGGSVSISQGLGTTAELIRELGDGTTARGLARLLDEASRDLWRGSDLSPDERAAGIAAGRHAAIPAGPDCERFSPETLPGLLGPHEELYDSSHHSISLIRCEHCGQLFVQEYVEVWDDGWIFWARVSDEEAELIRQDLGWSAALIQSRRHITRPPQSDEPMYWSDGDEHVLRMGPRDW